MTTPKPKRWSRRSRTALCPSSAPQVVTEQPASLRDEYPPNSNKSYSRVLEDLQEHENLTKVENLPAFDPRVKHIRARIANAMPFLNELSNKASASRQFVLTRLHAEQVVLSGLDEDRNSCNPPKKSSNPPPAAPQFATQGASPVQHLKEVSPKTRTSPQKRRAPSPVSRNIVNRDSQISPHQIAMMTAVHSTLSNTCGCRDASCSWSEAPAAVSPEELLSLVEAAPAQHHPAAPPSGATHRFPVTMMQAQLPQSQQPNHALQYQSSAYLPMQPLKLASSSIHGLRGNGASDAAD